MCKRVTTHSPQQTIAQWQHRTLTPEYSLRSQCLEAIVKAACAERNCPRKTFKFQRVQVSLSGCHFLPCSWGTPFAQKKRNSIASRGVPRGFSEKWHLFSLVLLCMRPMNKCHFRMRTWGGSQGTPRCSRNTQTKNDTLKMTLGRARQW